MTSQQSGQSHQPRARLLAPRTPLPSAAHLLRPLGLSSLSYRVGGSACEHGATPGPAELPGSARTVSLPTDRRGHPESYCARAAPSARSTPQGQGPNHGPARWTAPRLRTLREGGPGAGPRAQVRGGGPARGCVGGAPAGVPTGGSLGKSGGLAKVILSKQRNPGKNFKISILRETGHVGSQNIL